MPLQLRVWGGGGQCVLMNGMILLLILLVVNLDTQLKLVSLVKSI